MERIATGSEEAVDPEIVASLVVPSRGGRNRLPVLLAALAAQSEPRWEAIVVLDGDIDGSAEFLERYGDPRVRVIEFPENRGRSAALNAGHESARGGVLVRCDDDLEPGSDYVRQHVEAHQDRDVGVVGLCLNRYPANRYAAVYGQPQDELFRQEAYATPPDRRWRYWAGNVSITREQWERVGPYDTAFRAYGWEDVDWGYRLFQAGTEVVLDPGLETPHHVAAVTTQVRAMRAYASGAAKARFLAKHGSVIPSTPARGLWGRATEIAGRASGEKVIQTLARGVDGSINRLPETIARKAVAFTVESAARSGERRRPKHDATVGRLAR